MIQVVEPEVVVPEVVVPDVVVPEVVVPEVVVPSVVPRGLALPAGVPLMSLAEVVPPVVFGVVPPEESAFSEAVQALNTVSDEHKSAPESNLRFISRKCGKEASIGFRVYGHFGCGVLVFSPHKHVFFILLRLSAHRGRPPLGVEPATHSRTAPRE